jgi:hypothetical protein
MQVGNPGAARLEAPDEVGEPAVRDGRGIEDCEQRPIVLEALTVALSPQADEVLCCRQPFGARTSQPPRANNP